MWRHLWAVLTVLPATAPAVEDTEAISEIVVTSQRHPQSVQRHAGNIERLDASVLVAVNAQHIH
jgi:hypothetical protein